MATFFVFGVVDDDNNCEFHCEDTVDDLSLRNYKHDLERTDIH